MQPPASEPNVRTKCMVQTWRSSYRSDDFVPDTDAKCKDLLRHMPLFVGRRTLSTPTLYVTEPSVQLESTTLDDTLKREKRQLLLALLRPEVPTCSCTVQYVTCADEVHSVLFTFLLQKLLRQKRIASLSYELRGSPFGLTTTQQAVLKTARECGITFEIRLYQQQHAREADDDGDVMERLKAQSIVNEIGCLVNSGAKGITERTMSDEVVTWRWCAAATHENDVTS